MEKYWNYFEVKLASGCLEFIGLVRKDSSAETIHYSVDRYYEDGHFVEHEKGYFYKSSVYAGRCFTFPLSEMFTHDWVFVLSLQGQGTTIVEINRNALHPEISTVIAE